VSNNPAANQAQQEYGGGMGNMPAVQGNNFNGTSSMQGKQY